MTNAVIEGTVKIGVQDGDDQINEMEISAEVAEDVTVTTIEHLEVFDNNAVVDYGIQSYELGEGGIQRYAANRVVFGQTTRVRWFELSLEMLKPTF